MIIKYSQRADNGIVALQEGGVTKGQINTLRNDITSWINRLVPQWPENQEKHTFFRIPIQVNVRAIRNGTTYTITLVEAD